MAYSMEEIIKPVCIYQCIYLCALSRSRFLINFHQNWHRRTNPKSKKTSSLGSTSHYPFPHFALKTPILGQEVLKIHANINH